MLAFDTNLVVYATHPRSPQHIPAREFLATLADRDDVVVCELMLVELYLKLRNPAIFSHPMDSRSAAALCGRFRENPRWMLVESAPVIAEVWKFAAKADFGFRRIIDARLALILRHHGVSDFATSNVKDFEGFGFSRVWNPVAT